LGEWIEIGRTERDLSQKRSKILASGKRTGSEVRGTFIKVEEIK
jgi:hypothetical protein